MSGVSEALAWKYPTVEFAIAEGVIVRWDGPAPQPTQAEIDLALTEFAAHQAVPQTITKVQAVLALDALDPTYLDQIDALVAAPGQRQAKLRWTNATAIDRNDPLVAGLGAQLNPPLNAVALDQLFIMGAEL